MSNDVRLRRSSTQFETAMMKKSILPSQTKIAELKNLPNSKRYHGSDRPVSAKY